MHASDALWHLLGFCAPAFGLAGFSVLLARLVWRAELRGRRIVRLWLWTSAAAFVAALAGLVVFEHDGRMATYGAMVVAAAVAIWWTGLRRAKP